MITSKFIQTPRIRMHLLQSEQREDAPALIFIHGNASSSEFWRSVMSYFADSFNVIAPDLRGYGKTEDQIIDATHGFGDQTEDLLALMDVLEIRKAHLVGHSMGGGLIYELISSHPSRVLSATLVNPVSPYGFGGTAGAEGQLVNEDASGTGGGVANPEFARRISEQDRSEEDPNASPRCVMNTYYFKPPFRASNEEALLSGILEQKIGEERYPGDHTTSDNWPFVAPGRFGPVNAASPKYLQGLAGRFIHTSPKPAMLWVRGSEDQIVSDESLFDMATLGKLGLIDGYPGEKLYPPQPMITQTRQVLRSYEKNGGYVEEYLIEDTGHTPFLEKPDIFNAKLREFLYEFS